eukprot:PITA_30932
MGQSIKLFYIIIVVLIIITLHAHICHAQQHTCRANVTSTTGSKFESNLKAVLDNLVQHTSQTAFNTGMYGQSPDQVYGLLQCTGDTTVEQCYNCSLQASASLGKFCGNASGGLIWLGDCFLRYENYSFIGQLDTGDGWYLYNVNNVSSPDAFMTALGNLFTKLSGQAASSSKFFASGTITDSLSRKIYGLVQCWRDISSDDCTTCLSNTMNYISTVYTGRQGARGLIGSCMVRYETYPFFNSSSLPAPSPAPSPEAPPDAQPNNTEIYPSQDCNTTYNFSESSAFQTNLNRVLVSLSHNTSETGFNTSKYGESPDQIYGLLQCRGDTTVDQCGVCATNALTAARQYCAYAAGGSIWFESCFIRYENFSFIGHLSTFKIIMSRPQNQRNVPFIEVFNRALRSLFDNLTVQAVHGSASWNRYASGTTNDSLSRNIYGLVQCWRDLSTTDCKTCLSYTINSTLAYSAGRQGAQGSTRNCIVRYEIYRFFNSTTRPPALPAGEPAPKLNNTQTHSSPKKVYLIPGVVAGGSEVEQDARISEDGQLIMFKMETLLAATENFHDDKKLGEGGFGRVQDPNHRKQLDWQKRYNIILGVARGLLYLHQDSVLRIIHRDIKASNILLDEKLNPKIADFGLAKHFPDNESHVSTRLAGTFGYMAPEYGMQGQLSVKADVYSFGVLLLEVITGRKNTNYSLSPEMQILLGWAWRSYEQGNVVQMIDPAIIETCDKEQALRCIHVGLLCTQAEASLRPPISEAIQMLSSDSVILPSPTKPVFVSSITQTTTRTGSSSGLSRASASTTSASSSLTPVAPASNVYASITELVPR